MNIYFKFISLLTKNNQSRDKGFTLIELLVVVIIIGVLAAISIPNYIAQTGKARETEAKNNLGSLAKAQQAYHFEKQVFADTLQELSLSYMQVGKYHNISITDASSTAVRHQATAINAQQDQVRDYAIGAYFNAGLFSFTFCQASGLYETVDAPLTNGGNCTNGGIRLK